MKMSPAKGKNENVTFILDYISFTMFSSACSQTGYMKRGYNICARIMYIFN